MTIKQNIKQALKDFKKEYGHYPYVYKDSKNEFFYEDREIENLAWKLDKNNISVNYVLVEGHSDSYVIATYWMQKLKETIILDWDAETVFDNEEALIGEIERLENKGRTLNKNITLKSNDKNKHQ